MADMENEAKDPRELSYKMEAQTFLDCTKRAIGSIIIPAGFCDAVDAIIEMEGKIVTTGMGKAGHVAQKCASSLCSLTFPAAYLHPGDASHGDVGIVGPGDILLAFSTSGKTREVIETIEFAKRLGVEGVISITSHPDGLIRSISDIVLDMGVIEEAGTLSLAPTTSIVAMIIISDMLALVAARAKGVTKDDYGLRHHGGYLGKKCRGEEK